MKITVTHSPDEENYGQYEGLRTELKTDNYSGSADFSGGEPEDMILGRDLNDAYEIKSMLVAAYEAGKAGEELVVEELEEEE